MITPKEETCATGRPGTCSYTVVQQVSSSGGLGSRDESLLMRQACKSMSHTWCVSSTTSCDYAYARETVVFQSCLVTQNLLLSCCRLRTRCEGGSSDLHPVPLHVASTQLCAPHTYDTPHIEGVL